MTPTATPQQIEQYRRDGYVVVPGVLSRDEATKLAEHFMKRRAEGPKPGDMVADAARPGDPLQKFPRMIQMHDWDDVTARYAADPRLTALAGQFMGDEAALNQTMLYFKPPGARGQAFHQDQQYITIDPLIGVWVALDDCDARNGQMTVVPGSHKLGILPVEAADPDRSFTGGQSKLPPGTKEVGVDMKAGDVLFFHGKTIHGSHPNVTADRFRRSFICHFVGAHAKKFTPKKGTHMTDLLEKAPESAARHRQKA